MISDWEVVQVVRGVEETKQEMPSIPLKDGTEWEMPYDFMRDMCEGHQIDRLKLQEEMREMRAWCVSNPSKKKTRRGIKRFVNNWLKNSKKPPPWAQREEKSFKDRIMDTDF